MAQKEESAQRGKDWRRRDQASWPTEGQLPIPLPAHGCCNAQNPVKEPAQVRARPGLVAAPAPAPQEETIDMAKMESLREMIVAQLRKICADMMVSSEGVSLRPFGSFQECQS